MVQTAFYIYDRIDILFKISKSRMQFLLYFVFWIKQLNDS